MMRLIERVTKKTKGAIGTQLCTTFLISPPKVKSWACVPDACAAIIFEPPYVKWAAFEALADDLKFRRMKRAQLNDNTFALL